MSNLTIEQKREIVAQRIQQFERELYMNELNEKILVATSAPSEQITFVRNEMKRCSDSLVVLEEEANILA